MSELIIIGYDDHETAEKAYHRVQQLQHDFVVELSGLAVVRVDEDGKRHVDTPGSLVGVSAASGATWGLLFGLIFLTPGVGLLLGGLWGALLGRIGKSGIDRAFSERVTGMLGNGKAALVLMATKLTEDKFNAGIAEFGGQVLKTSLSEADEKELQQMLGVHDNAATATEPS
ncbi:DUF1269 domain-containing protein [Granulicoccus phenolivorans]|uniref:DUF1269 domain-containing protein n=1 Tax=Granulicoccus phenolivorans TaxID=266854 RepID=UPI000408CFB4|nr:DUF1269 domain-containing protein [Granulicoccus phenolivorans]